MTVKLWIRWRVHQERWCVCKKKVRMRESLKGKTRCNSQCLLYRWDPNLLQQQIQYFWSPFHPPTRSRFGYTLFLPNMYPDRTKLQVNQCNVAAFSMFRHNGMIVVGQDWKVESIFGWSLNNTMPWFTISPQNEHFAQYHIHKAVNWQSIQHCIHFCQENVSQEK